MNLLLIGRNEKKLQEIGNELQNIFKIEYQTLAVDFSKGPEVYSRIKTSISNLDVGILINNVGVCTPFLSNVILLHSLRNEQTLRISKW